jgi:tetratricopeptide (TPR) repeat protein
LANWIRYHTRSTLFKSTGTTTLNNIGGVYFTIGQPQKTLEYYNQALPILREVGNRDGVATTLSNIGVVYSSIGQPQKTLEYYNQALPILREVIFTSYTIPVTPPWVQTQGSKLKSAKADWIRV